MRGLPSEAFDMLVRTLARICDDPYDPVFSTPVPPALAGVFGTHEQGVHHDGITQSGPAGHSDAPAPEVLSRSRSLELMAEVEKP